MYVCVILIKLVSRQLHIDYESYQKYKYLVTWINIKKYIIFIFYLCKNNLVLTFQGKVKGRRLL